MLAGLKECLLPDGSLGRAAVIQLGGAFAQSGRPRPPSDWRRLDPAGIAAAATAAGIAFDPDPLGVLLTAARARSPGVLVVNAIESEPWLAAEFRLLCDRPNDVAAGLRMAQTALGCPRVVLAVVPDAVEPATAVASACREAGLDVEVSVFEERYPQEEESRLAAALLDREPPRGGSAADLGAEVVRVSSIVALCDAVLFGKPCFERVVTVGGPAIGMARNFKVRIGTTVGGLLGEAGGSISGTQTVVLGSPMCGHAFRVESTGWRDVPVTQDVPAVLLFDRRDLPRGRQRPCLRCGRCLDACPWGLVPVRLRELAGSGSAARADREGLGECRECGCCSYACPSRIPLAHGLREARALAAGAAG
jgi:electron transport complex protein RnfC